MLNALLQVAEVQVVGHREVERVMHSGWGSLPLQNRGIRQHNNLGHQRHVTEPPQRQAGLQGDVQLL